MTQSTQQPLTNRKRRRSSSTNVQVGIAGHELDVVDHNHVEEDFLLNVRKNSGQPADLGHARLGLPVDGIESRGRLLLEAVEEMPVAIERHRD